MDSFDNLSSQNKFSTRASAQSQPRYAYGGKNRGCLSAVAQNYAVMSAIFPMAAFEAYSEKKKKQRASETDSEAKIESEI